MKKNISKIQQYFDDNSLSNDSLVENLTRVHKKKIALQQLMKLGVKAIPLLKKGLRHDNKNVRIGCLRVLDHFYDESVFSELFSNLENNDPEIRMWAIHALACENCKIITAAQESLQSIKVRPLPRV